MTYRRSLFEEDDLSCPECGSGRSIRKDLVLLYSSCCGAIRCHGCVRDEFDLKRKVSIKCSSCGATLKRANYRDIPLERQHFEKENAIRSKMERISMLERGDFDSDRKYDDYLEMLSDIVIDRAHGTDEEKRAAEKRVIAFEKEFASKLRKRAAQSSSSSAMEIVDTANPQKPALPNLDGRVAIKIFRPFKRAPRPRPRGQHKPKDPFSIAARRASGHDEKYFYLRAQDSLRSSLFYFGSS